MTFKYGLTIAAPGGNKLRRFRAWTKQHFTDLDFSLPPQTPIETETLTVRLRSLEDRQRIRVALANEPLP
jgi:hypothetical protein